MAGEAGIAIAFLMIGMVFGNIIMVYVAMVPFLFLLFSMAYPAMGGLKLARKSRIIKSRLNETVTISTTYTMDSGTGIYAVADPLPEHVGLVSGTNFHVFWNKRKAPIQVSYDVSCTKRGIYTIGPAKIECFHHSGMDQPLTKLDADSTRLIVDPERQNIKKLRDPKLLSSMPVPVGAVSKLGMRTTDFTEIRRYQPGDPYRTINWKATARFQMTADAVPYVNEYEKEGKKTIFIFVDAGAWAGSGPEAEHVFDHMAQAATGIASFYLERNMRVGVYVYNHGKLIVPDGGKRQESRIVRDLFEIRASSSQDSNNGLKMAVKECSGHLFGITPMFIVLTMAGRKNTPDIIEGIKSMRKYSPAAKLPKVTLLHIKGYNLEAKGELQEAGASVLEFDSMRYVRAIKKCGALVVPWDPKTMNLNQLMMSGFGRRKQ